MERNAEVYRKTAETEVNVRVDLDGGGIYNIQTPAFFLNHMLTLFSRHALFDLDIKAKGDVSRFPSSGGRW